MLKVPVPQTGSIQFDNKIDEYPQMKLHILDIVQKQLSL